MPTPLIFCVPSSGVFFCNFFFLAYVHGNNKSFIVLSIKKQKSGDESVCL